MRMGQQAMKTKGTPESYAKFSPCERYRYELGRIWDSEVPPLVWIGLNPSTADELELDPTLTRIQKRSQDFGAGGFIMLNLFAYRATNPFVMKKQKEPVGPLNNLAIHHYLKHQIVACWGSHGCYKDRGKEVLDMLLRAKTRLYFLELTKYGQPKHPLYLGYDVELKEWTIDNSVKAFMEANRKGVVQCEE